jgi:hypothetical protein
MNRQPQISVLQNADFGFGIWPWAKGPLYRLEERDGWTFNVEGRTFTVPHGYCFDGASVPAFFWGAPFGYTPFGLHIAAALEHDYLCDLGKQGKLPFPSKVAHAHFERRLIEDGLRKGQVWTMGHAVKWFGPRWK